MRRCVKSQFSLLNEVVKPECHSGSDEEYYWSYNLTEIFERPTKIHWVEQPELLPTFWTERHCALSRAATPRGSPGQPPSRPSHEKEELAEPGHQYTCKTNNKYVENHAAIQISGDKNHTKGVNIVVDPITKVLGNCELPAASECRRIAVASKEAETICRLWQ